MTTERLQRQDGSDRMMSATQIRRKLRREMPPSEWMLWQRLRGHRLSGYKFRRKHGVGPYIVDFYCREAHLAIEICDAVVIPGWGGDARRRAREEFLGSLGIEIMRITDDEITADLEALVMKVAQRMRQRLAGSFADR